MKRVLSFDISSTTCGWAVLDWDKSSYKLIKCGYIKPSKKDTLFKSLAMLKIDILNLIRLHKPDEIAIENIVEFMAQKSSAKAIIKLAIYNRTVGLACFEETGKEPHLYSVMSIRHKLKLSKVLPKKEEMPLILEKHLEMTFPWVKKLKKKKGSKVAVETVCDESYDVADGICVGLYHCMINQK